MRLLWQWPGNEVTVVKAWEWGYCDSGLGMRLLQWGPGNEVTASRGLGMRLL